MKVLRGRDLISKDSNGFSDPYVKTYILKADGKKDSKSKKKLPIRKKTLNPDWSDEAPIQYTIAADDLRSISVTCWDSDFGRNDFMGEILLTKEMLLSIEGSSEEWHALQPMVGQKGDVSGGLLLQVTVGEASEAGTPGKKAKKSRFGLFKKSKPGAAASSSSVDDFGEGETSAEGSQSAEMSQESEESPKEAEGEAEGEAAPEVTPVEQLEEEEENDGVGEDIAPVDGKVRLRIKYDPEESNGTLFVKLLECQDLDVPGKLEQAKVFAVLQVDDGIRKSDAESETAYPVYNQNFVFEGVSKSRLEVTFWDQENDMDATFVGKSVVDLSELDEGEAINITAHVEKDAAHVKFLELYNKMNPNAAAVGMHGSDCDIMDKVKPGSTSAKAALSEPRVHMGFDQEGDSLTVKVTEISNAPASQHGDHAEYYILATLGSEKKWSKPYAQSRDMMVNESFHFSASKKVIDTCDLYLALWAICDDKEDLLADVSVPVDEAMSGDGTAWFALGRYNGKKKPLPGGGPKREKEESGNSRGTMPDSKPGVKASEPTAATKQAQEVAKSVEIAKVATADAGSKVSPFRQPKVVAGAAGLFILLVILIKYFLL